MTDGAIEAALLSDVSNERSGRVIVGFNWTAVEGPNGIGLAASPSRQSGASTTEETGSYGGKPLNALAALLRSDNGYERAIGLAACNAHWNAPHAGLEEGSGLELADAKVAVIGRFPDLERRLPNATVLELNPGPKDRPASDAPDILPHAEAVVITATTLVNGTLQGLLNLVRRETPVILVGPSTPLCPSLLQLGVSELAGFVVEDREGCLKAVMEGAGARALKRFGRQVLLAG